MSYEFVCLATSLVCTATAAVFDVRNNRIPNLLTFPCVGAGLLLHLGLGGWRELGTAAAAATICGFLFLLVHLAGGMGAGDVKLIMAAGCISGLPLITRLLLFTSFAGGVMGIVLAIYRRKVKETMRNIWVLAMHHQASGLAPHPEINIDNSQALRLPYALAIAAGSALNLCLLIGQR